MWNNGGSDCRARNWQTQIFLLSLSFCFSFNKQFSKWATNDGNVLVGLVNLVQSHLSGFTVFFSYMIPVCVDSETCPSPCAGSASELCVFVLEQDEKKWWESGRLLKRSWYFLCYFSIG